MAHILVADDDRHEHRSLAVALQRAGHRITEAAEGQEALDRITEELPEALVLDLMMPRMDGFELLRELRSTPATQQLPVVMLTAQSADGQDLLGWNDAQLDYVFKPLRPQQVVAKVDWFLRTGAPPRYALVADDSWEVRRLIAQALRDAGLRVRLAVDGADALAQVAERRPDLVVLDTRLSGLSGFEVVNALRAAPATRGIPVILLSKPAPVGDYLRTGSADGCYRVEKPLSSAALTRLVELACSSSLGPELLD